MSRIPTLALPLACALALAPRAASACGGFFCDAVEPVLQTAERILFQVHADGTVTTTVEIQFEGGASDFGWVLPLGQEIDPDAVATAPAGLFDELEAATAPRFVQPADAAGVALDLGYASGCGAGCGPWGPGGPGGVDGFVPVFDAVEVVGEAVVGPYAVEIIRAGDAAQLTGWLQQNGYAVPGAAAEPIAHYVASGAAFLGLKLQPDVPEGPIDALSFTTPADAPLLPLILTSIAAAPEMDITAYVLADERWAPANYADVQVDFSRVQWDEEDGTDYLQRLSATLDAEGGRGFQTEFAGPAADLPAGEASAELLASGAYLTRFRALLDPEEMTVDPVWRPAPELGDVPNVHEISGVETAGAGLLALLLVPAAARRRRREGR